MPIRPVINNTRAPSHKIAKFLNTRLKNMEILPNIYNIKNSLEIAEEISKIHINQHMRLITLDIRDLYFNLPTQGIIQAAKFWLHKNAYNIEETKQIFTLPQTIMEQNYFQYNNLFYKPKEGVAMGSPLSGTLAELYLQRIENNYIKQCIDSEEIYYYKRYVDDIIILFNINKIQEEQLLQGINHIEQNLTFKLTTEDNNKINFLGLTITRKISKLEIGIYRKETNTDTVIHYLSNHPTEQKMTTFRCYINRLATLPITQEEKTTEWTAILNMAKNNAFPTYKIVRL